MNEEECKLNRKLLEEVKQYKKQKSQYSSLMSNNNYFPNGEGGENKINPTIIENI